MKKSPKGVAKRGKQVRHRVALSNYIVFPQTLRDSFFGKRVRLKLLAQESGKLKGTFEIGVDLEVEAARALAATLLNLTRRA